MFISPKFMQFALCKNNKEIDFHSDSVTMKKAAVAFCQHCSVIQPCLQYAIENKIEYGVWGGKTAYARKNLTVISLN